MPLRQLKTIGLCSWVLAAAWGGPGTASAHVPYLETQDLEFTSPFIALDPAQSIAVYAWLESAEDVDVFLALVTRPTELFIELLVPVCPEYEAYYPQFALLGPSLPGPAIPVGGGYRLLVAPWAEREEPRGTFFEPFGGKSYYEGPRYSQPVTVPGLYFLLVWDPEGNQGDYVVGIGKEERWPLPDILRALINTPIIRRNEELHSPCGQIIRSHQKHPENGPVMAGLVQEFGRPLLLISGSFWPHRAPSATQAG